MTTAMPQAVLLLGPRHCCCFCCLGCYCCCFEAYYVPPPRFLHYHCFWHPMNQHHRRCYRHCTIEEVDPHCCCLLHQRKHHSGSSGGSSRSCRAKRLEVEALVETQLGRLKLDLPGHLTTKTLGPGRALEGLLPVWAHYCCSRFHPRSTNSTACSSAAIVPEPAAHDFAASRMACASQSPIGERK